MDKDDDGIARPASDTDSDAKDRVGYGKPPRHTRFKRGRSGNRKGRPKGAEGRKMILKRVAGEMHRIIEHGKPRRRSTLELVVLWLRNRAVEGSVTAFRAIHDLLARFGPQEPQQVGYYVIGPEVLTVEEWVRKYGKLAERQRELKDDPEDKSR